MITTAKTNHLRTSGSTRLRSDELRHGFTLVELLLSMAIIGVLASILIVAINPTKQLGDARNTQRKFDVNSILNALGQYSIDNDGFFQPDSVTIDACKISSTAKKLCKAGTVHGNGVGECGDAAVACVWSNHLNGTYVADIPIDPRDDETTVAEQAMVDYTVSSQAPGRIQVLSPNAENDSIIGAMR